MLALFRFRFRSFRRLGLSAGCLFLTLEISLLFEYILFKAQQTGVAGHGLQALFNVDQAHLQRAFLLGALGLFEELFGLQLRLPKLLLRRCLPKLRLDIDGWRFRSRRWGQDRNDRGLRSRR